ncbi:MAG: MFS transporter, partial [Muribaculaceae bacterium]|nr:MFS transporter [Muribaculaceae bacterium]
LWLIAKKMYLPRIQTLGFFLSALAMIILGISYHFDWPHWISIGAFMAFELFLNMGPHLITYVLPPAIYPVAIRGRGSGLAAAIGKIGAVLAVFFIPFLLKVGGALTVLVVSAAVMLTGGLITRIFGPEVMPQKK